MPRVRGGPAVTPEPRYRLQRRSEHLAWRTIAHSPNQHYLIATTRPGQHLRILDPHGQIIKEWTA